MHAQHTMGSGQNVFFIGYHTNHLHPQHKIPNLFFCTDKKRFVQKKASLRYVVGAKISPKRAKQTFGACSAKGKPLTNPWADPGNVPPGKIISPLKRKIFFSCPYKKKRSRMQFLPAWSDRNAIWDGDAYSSWHIPHPRGMVQSHRCGAWRCTMPIVRLAT